MRSVRVFLLLFVTPVLLSVTVAGCKKKTDEEEDIRPVRPGSKGAAAAKEEPVTVKAYTTLKGRIVYDGTPPSREDIKAQVNENKDKGHCLADPTQDSFELPSWKVGKDNGVDGVVIWVRPPKGKVFPPPDKDKWPVVNDEVIIDQPFCAFEPQVSVVLPFQKAIIRNSASITHNTSYRGNPAKNPGGNVTLSPKMDDMVRSQELTVKPDAVMPIKLNCDIHKWMSGTLWVSDTPYAVVSRNNRKDGKPDGYFELKNVPADMDVRLVMWGGGSFLDGGAEGKTIKFKAGEEDLGDIKVKAK